MESMLLDKCQDKVSYLLSDGYGDSDDRSSWNSSVYHLIVSAKSLIGKFSDQIIYRR
jgi:hypothetical protein